MNGYLCALRLTGERLRRSEIFGPMARVVGGATDRLVSAELGAFAGVARVEGSALRPLVARWKQWVAVGDVRLDNAAHLAQLAGWQGERGSDLELLLALLDARGPECVSELHGDFAFVAWDARGQKLVAARDPFGVKPLFHARRGNVLLFSSRLAAFEGDDACDLDFIADYLVTGGSDGEHTIWSGARALPAGGVLVQRGTTPTLRRYWRADAFVPEPEPAGDETELALRFRELFREGVRAGMSGGETWAQLSGGLDSSSVVATVQALHAGGELPRGLGGTVTIVDSLGNGDERAYSDEIVSRWGVRNECVHDYWAWRDDGAGAPHTDEPRPIYPFFERDRALVAGARAGGARVLLSGMGSDHLLYGNLGYIADLAARGHVGAALGEAARWSVAHRQSFWSTARHTLVQPFLPRRLQLGLVAPALRVPAWIRPEFGTAHALAERLPGTVAPARPGRLFQASVAAEVGRLPIWMDREPFNDEIEMRYPFLYRPLVEFCLRLPPAARVRPEGRKWILREAMRDVLPERVRRRAGKGGMDARILWSLQRERRRLDELLRQPMLAELGCVDAVALRGAVEAARHGVVPNLVTLMHTLSLETWLAVRAGRWVPEAKVARTAA